MAYYRDLAPRKVNDKLVGYQVSEDLLAVKNSLRNLFSIRLGTVPGKPWLGNPIDVHVFDNIGFFEKRTIEDAFRNVIEKFEPRVEIASLGIEVSNEFQQVTVYMEYYVLIDSAEVYDNLRISLAQNEMTAIVTRTI